MLFETAKQYGLMVLIGVVKAVIETGDSMSMLIWKRTVKVLGLKYYIYKKSNGALKPATLYHKQF